MKVAVSLEKSAQPESTASSEVPISSEPTPRSRRFCLRGRGEGWGFDDDIAVHGTGRAVGAR